MNFKRLLIAVLGLILVACVTTEPKLFSKKVSKEKELQSRLQIASSYLQDNQPEAAMRHLKLAMELKSDSAPLHEILALTLEKMGDDEQVESHFKKMLRYDSSYSRGRANYGSYLIRQGNYKEAYKQFTVVTQDIYYTNRPVAYQQLAKCAQQLGKDDEIVSFYQKALAIDEGFVPALYELAEYSFSQGNYPLASKYFEQYRSKTTKSSARALLLGIKISRVFKDGNAEASYALALANLYPKSQEYLDYMAMKGK